MELGEKIRSLRISKHMTLEQVGLIVGVGKSTVRKWENGDIKNMGRDKIELVAKALDVSPTYLMGWEDISDHIHEELDPALGFDTAAARKLREIGRALTPSESELLEIYRNLNDMGRLALLATARGLSGNPDMSKSGRSD